MTTDLSDPKAFKEHVRMRPAMYFGNDYVTRLFYGLIIDCIAVCNTDEIIFEITVQADNNYSLVLSSKHDLSSFIQSFDFEEVNFLHYFAKALKVIAKELEIVTTDSNKTIINFSLDKDVIADQVVDYPQLNEQLLLIALLNRKSEIISIDKRRKYFSQNYYHFPQGVLYLFTKEISMALGKPKFMLTFDDHTGLNKYLIGLAYRTDWHPTATIYSFANDVYTSCGGSLVIGIIDGLVAACRKFVKENNLTTFKINRKKFINGLILVCAVRGDNFVYGGSFKETLENDEVRKQAKKIAEKSVLSLFRNKSIANEFLSRFDTTNLTSGMYH